MMGKPERHGHGDALMWRTWTILKREKKKKNHTSLFTSVNIHNCSFISRRTEVDGGGGGSEIIALPAYC